MEKKFDEFSMREAKRLAQTDAGKQLMALYQQQGHAAPGKDADMEELKRSIANVMRDPKAQALLQQIQEESHGRNGR